MSWSRRLISLRKVWTYSDVFSFCSSCFFSYSRWTSFLYVRNSFATLAFSSAASTLASSATTSACSFSF